MLYWSGHENKIVNHNSSNSKTELSFYGHCHSSRYSCSTEHLHSMEDFMEQIVYDPNAISRLSDGYSTCWVKT